jgi:hypothetical protein
MSLLPSGEASEGSFQPLTEINVTSRSTSCRCCSSVTASRREPLDLSKIAKLGYVEPAGDPRYAKGRASAALALCTTLNAGRECDCC